MVFSSPICGSSISSDGSTSIIISSSEDIISNGGYGEGTSHNPFILENVEISSNTGVMVRIVSLDQHLIIRNSTLNGNDIADAIEIVDSSYITIENSVISNSRNGIRVSGNSNYIKITKNVFSDNYQGLIFDNGSHGIIAENRFIENDNLDLHLKTSSFNQTVVWNDFVDVDNDLTNVIDDGSYNTFSNNYWDDFAQNDEDLNIIGTAKNIDIKPVTNEVAFSEKGSILSDFRVYETLNGTNVILFWSPVIHSEAQTVTYSVYRKNDGAWFLILDGLTRPSYTIDENALNDFSETQQLKIIALSQNESVEANLIVHGRKSDGSPFSQNYMVYTILVILLIIAIYRNFILDKIRGLLFRIRIPKEIKAIIGTLPPAMQIIFTEDDIDTEKYPKFPLELLSFKFILNPVRLAILKLLDTNVSLAAFELRQELNVSWGNLTPHLNLLEEKKYIETSTQFVNSKPVKIARILPYGNKVLSDLQDVLVKLFDL